MMYRNTSLKAIILSLIIVVLLPTLVVKGEERNKTKIKEDRIVEAKNYFILDKIYGVEDLNELIKKIDYLNDQGIPFICSVMPVYNNVDLKAMRRFTEIIRYAQAKGAKIFLHGADLYGASVNGKELYDKTALGYVNYVDYHVYPIGLDIPDSWLYKEDYKEILYKTNTLILEGDNKIKEENKIEDIKLEHINIKTFQNIIYKMDLKNVNSEYKGELYKNMGLSLEADLDFQEFKEQIEALEGKNIVLSDPKYIDTTIEFNNKKITNSSKGVWLNEINVKGEGFITEGEIKSTIEEDNKKVKEFNLKGANNIIILVTVIVCIIFVIIAFISRRIDRKKYFK